MPNPVFTASALRPVLRAGIALLAATWLAGCGQKGPLHLPTDEPTTNANTAVDGPEATPNSKQV